MLQRPLILITLFYIAGILLRIAAESLPLIQAILLTAAVIAALTGAVLRLTSISRGPASAPETGDRSQKSIIPAMDHRPSHNVGLPGDAGNTAKRILPVLLLPFCLLAGLLRTDMILSSGFEAFESGGSMEVRYQGRILSVSEKEASVWYTLTDTTITDIETGRSIHTDVILKVSDLSGEILCPGDLLQGQGSLSEFDRATNPGQFDIYAYYLTENILYQIRTDTLPEIRYYLFRNGPLQRLRRAAREALGALYDSESAGLLTALLLGDRSDLDTDLKDAWQALGIIHLLSISGAHIALMGLGLEQLLRRCGTGLKVSALSASGLILLYLLMIGASVTAWRAAIMFWVSMGGQLLGRSYDRPCGLALSVLLILIKYPLMITGTGLLLACLSILGLILMLPRFREALPRWPVSIAATLSVLVMITPLTARIYGCIPVLAPLCNLLLVPLITPLLPAGLLSLLLYALWPAGAGLLSGPVAVMIHLLSAVSEGMAGLPFAQWYTGSPPTVMLIIIYSFIGLYCLQPRLRSMASAGLEQPLQGPPHKEPGPGHHFSGQPPKTALRRLFLSPAPLLAAMILCLIPVRRLGAMAAFLDVGQGDCAFLRTDDGTTWLIDGGSSSVSEAGRYRLLPFLHYYGEDHIDYACVSHGDIDHYSIIEELLEEGLVGHLVVTGYAAEDDALCELTALAGEKACPVIYVSRGSTWQSGCWTFECLWPEDPVGTSDDAAGTAAISHIPQQEVISDTNDQSMVLLISTGTEAADLHFLFTGDISSDYEPMLTLGNETSIDILKAAHHGSASSSCDAFLDKLDCPLALISCGRNNRYGHPAPETLDRLTAHGMAIWNTAVRGAYVLTIP